jgi:hypothetical protein
MISTGSYVLSAAATMRRGVAAQVGEYLQIPVAKAPPPCISRSPYIWFGGVEAYPRGTAPGTQETGRWVGLRVCLDMSTMDVFSAFARNRNSSLQGVVDRYNAKDVLFFDLIKVSKSLGFEKVTIS